MNIAAKGNWFQSTSTGRFVIGGAVVVVCLLMMNSAASFGLTKMIARYSVAENSIAAADEAVKLNPSDADAHYARAMLLNLKGSKLDALKEIELAAALRPRDDSLWIEVGDLRDANGDAAAALEAFDKAVRLAPYYGHPRWQRGSLLLRMGRYDEAFNELRVAALRNPNFVRPLIDLAWGVSRHDLLLTEQLVRPEDDRTRLVFARFLATHGNGAGALDQFRKISADVPQEVRADLIRSLIDAKAFREAFELWKTASGGATAIENGGFEQDLILDQSTFGWSVLKNDKVSFALDVNDPQEGARSLRITFDGYDNQAAVLSQLLLLKPQQPYRVSFAVKTRDLVTGGLPMLQVIDASTGKTLGAPETFQLKTDSWNTIVLEIKTGISDAVYVQLGRIQCSTSPCPIFGQLWLDSFSVEER